MIAVWRRRIEGTYLWYCEGLPYGTVRQEIFDGISWHSPRPHPLFQIFSIPEINERLKGSLTAFFGNVRQKIFKGNLDTFPSLLSINFFDTRNFLKHRRISLLNFLALWDKNFSTENRDTLLHKVRKSVVELMFVKKSLKTKFKTVVLFLTVCKSWSKYL